MTVDKGVAKAVSIAALMGVLVAASPVSFAETKAQKDEGAASTQGATGMQGMPGMYGMPGMQGMYGMPGMQGMPGMHGMPGMRGMQGMYGQGPQSEYQPVIKPVIDSPDKAREAGNAWLAFIGQQSLAVGAIKKVDWIYVVNIVDKDTPHNLRNQLVIRTGDGFTIAVAPMY